MWTVGCFVHFLNISFFEKKVNLKALSKSFQNSFVRPLSLAVNFGTSKEYEIMGHSYVYIPMGFGPCIYNSCSSWSYCVSKFIFLKYIRNYLHIGSMGIFRSACRFGIHKVHYTLCTTYIQ